MKPEAHRRIYRTKVSTTPSYRIGAVLTAIATHGAVSADVDREVRSGLAVAAVDARDVVQGLSIDTIVQ